MNTRIETIQGVFSESNPKSESQESQNDSGSESSFLEEDFVSIDNQNIGRYGKDKKSYSISLLDESKSDEIWYHHQHQHHSKLNSMSRNSSEDSIDIISNLRKGKKANLQYLRIDTSKFNRLEQNGRKRRTFTCCDISLSQMSKYPYESCRNISFSNDYNSNTTIY